MKYIKKALFLAFIGAGFMAPVQAAEVHAIICGGEIRPADQVVLMLLRQNIQALRLMLKQFLGERVRINL